MVSAKFYSDYDETDVYAYNFAYEGEISVERLKQLEISFLNAIQWNLLVSENEFFEKLKTVEKLLALKEGLHRSWFTYTEMEILTPKLEIAKQIIHYTTILMFTYVCSIATIALSSIILTSIPITLPSTELSSENVTSVALEALRLLPHVMISPEDAEQIECTFDASSVEFVDDKWNCNFTIDFSLFNNFDWEMKKNYQDITNVNFGLLGNHKPVPLIW